MAASVFQLQCSCNNYDWGRVGKNSLAATLCSRTPNSDFEIQDKPYAEMWMGDYPVQPAKDLKNGESLHTIIASNADKLLGRKCVDKFGGVLPFLPKILSIAKALPLQIHPNKNLSAKLHKEDPQSFTDPNHKPEIAVALGPFEVFAGFKTIEDIRIVFDSLPFLQKFVPEARNAKWSNATVRELTRNILNAGDESIQSAQEALARADSSKFGSQQYILDLLPRLQSQYPKQDPGTLIALLTMNYLKLDKGDAIYVPADAPHAYLSGNIVECMARSNNVLNTGFCPRADRDNVDLFTDCLTFSAHSDKDVLLPAKTSEKGRNRKTQVYAPPMSEFDMLRTRLGKGDTEMIVKIDGPSVLFVTDGQGTLVAEGEHFDLREGFIFFVGHGIEVELKGGSTDELNVWRAFAE